MANISWLGVNYSDVPYVEFPQTGGGTTTFTDVTDTTAVAADVASGKYFYTSAGVRTVGTNSGGGSTKNVQYYMGYGSAASSSYVSTGVSIKVTKAGTYKCSWGGWRQTTSGTSGTWLYKNGQAVGSAHTTFLNSYGQYCEETITLDKDDVVTIYARSRNSTYYTCAVNFIVEEQ